MPSDDPPVDVFEEAGVILPIQIRTRARRWACLCLLCLFCACGQALCFGYNTFMPLMIKQGVWAGPDQVSRLTTVSNISCSFLTFGAVPGGFLYDTIGPRKLAAMASFGAAVGLLGLGLALQIPSLNDLVWVTVPFVTAMGAANSFHMYAFLWLLPGEEGAASCILGVTTAIAGGIPLLAVDFNNAYGMPASFFFYLLAIAMVVGATLGWLILPPQQELQSATSRLLAFQAAAKDADAAAPPSGEDQGSQSTTGEARNDEAAICSEGRNVEAPKETGQVSTDDSGVFTTWYYAWVHLTRIIPRAWHTWQFSYIAYVFVIQTVVVKMYPIYEGLVGLKKTHELMNIFATVNLVGGGIGALLYGRLVDAVGLANWMNVQLLPMLAMVLCFSLPSVPACIVGQVLYSVMIGVPTVTTAVWAAANCPAELWGSSLSICQLISATCQIVCTTIMYQVTAAITRTWHRFLYAAYAWSVLNVIANVTLIIYWRYHPLPEIGSATVDQVRDFLESENQSQKTSDEASAECDPCPQKRADNVTKEGPRSPIISTK